MPAAIHLTSARVGSSIKSCIDRQPSAAPSSLVHYAIVRSDLSHGLQVANVGHAAGESCGGVPPGTIMVVLAVPDEQALRSVAERLGGHGLAHTLIVESEGDYAGQAMALGVAPTADRNAVRRAVSALPLVR